MNRRRTESSYDWDAEDYSRHSSVQFQWARELIPKLRLRGAEHVLDVGCGDGKVTAEIASLLKGGFVLGIDSSDSMIARAQEAYPEKAYPNLRFQREDARSLPFREDFDAVFSSATLHWVLDPRPVLLGIRQGLKSGGTALLQMGGRGNVQDMIDVLSTIIAAEEWRDYFEHFDHSFGFHGPEEYRAWLTEAGLIARRVEMFARDMAHPNQDALRGWIRTVWLPYTQRVPVQSRSDFISQVAANYVSRFPPDETGVTHVRVVRLEIEAFKTPAERSLTPY